MARKKKRALPTKSDPDVVTLYLKPDMDAIAEEAKIYLRPTVKAGATVRIFNKGKDGSGPDINALIAELGKQAEAVNRGDLTRAEAILIAQAHSLDAIFGNLARRAALNFSEYLNTGETYMRLALKAQSQCRATLETLAAIKNPHPIAFVKQANIASGHQQVNNGVMPGAHADGSRAREKESEQSKQLDSQGLSSQGKPVGQE